MAHATDVSPGSAGPVARPSAAGYYARIRGLLLTPTAEWAEIAAERPTLRQLFMRWALPLTLVFFLAPQLGAIAFPAQIDGRAVAPSLASALYTAFVGTVLMLGTVWALAWLIDYFAQAFGGKRNPEQAMKLAVYSGTGLWLSGLVGLAPPLVLLGAFGVVSIYTLYRGLPVLMQTPQDKTLPYAASVVGAAAVMAVVLMALSSCMTIFADAPRAKPAAAIAATAQTPTVQRDRAAGIEGDKLRRLMPDAMPGGWVRTGLTRNAGGALGFTGPTVEASYENGGRRLVLRAIDLSPAGAEAPLAALLATRPAQDDLRILVRHDAGGFTEIDRTGGSARRLIVVGDRVALYAEGTSLADLDAALALIDMVRVEQIARGL